eukprot:TRINITY_DN67529_c3_g11_i1.p1 TRINITY_DN67529_c3_g11~~TRINITY_DN67529_c3_g11_i1.p1  ORF type:complete len:471 (-),score=29.32 TRINITY_DN67529_c3_g11_i1:209-1621(-)
MSEEDDMVDCPVECGELVHKTKLQAHLLECRLQPVTCKYYSLGCTSLVPRGRLSEHYDHNVQSHLQRLDHHYQVLLKRLQVQANRNVMPVEMFYWDVGSIHCIHTLKAHTRPVLCLKVVNGELLSGSEDATLVLWNIAQGKKKGVLSGARGGVCCIETTPEGLVLTGHEDGLIHIWDMHLLAMANTLPAKHTDTVWALVYADVSRYIHLGNLVSSKKDPVEDSLDTIGGIPKSRLSKGSPYSTSSTEGKHIGDTVGMIFSGSADGTICVWRLETNEYITSMNGHTGAICTLCVIGDRLYSAGEDLNINAWDLKSEGFPQLPAMEAAHKATITSSLCMKMDILVTGSQDATIGLWSTLEGRCLTRLEGHDAGVQSLTRVNDDMFVSASWDHTFKVWSANQLTCLKTMPCSAISLVASDYLLFTGGSMNTVKVWTSERLNLNHQLLQETQTPDMDEFEAIQKARAEATAGQP